MGDTVHSHLPSEHRTVATNVLFVLRVAGSSVRTYRSSVCQPFSYAFVLTTFLVASMRTGWPQGRQQQQQARSAKLGVPQGAAAFAHPVVHSNTNAFVRSTRSPASGRGLQQQQNPSSQLKRYVHGCTESTSTCHVHQGPRHNFFNCRWQLCAVESTTGAAPVTEHQQVRASLANMAAVLTLPALPCTLDYITACLYVDISLLCATYQPVCCICVRVWVCSQAMPAASAAMV